ncbi:MAG: helix-turn-helix transcriptional regulator [Rhodobacteraceae bacterium]|nr:helix-turn-helix transcriptional regulator [Paracoccaceae bacterium]
MFHDDDSAAIALAALGHPARLSVFRLLVKAGPDGLMVGEIAAHLDMPLSTLSHHLRALKLAGLISQTRAGREVLTRAETKALHAVVDYLLSECCQGVHRRAQSA